ncbi:beta-lactamase domain protein [Ruminiclostridium papyrosolvens DSM 2782]|uniref:Beta-lactamase domain protein n=1 Tax=Ruminiclostridium papyrosolvens DSM 2782 TaxID=588581 RepID=F1TDF3_9FIRM|nr:MBL fold metallo-hydrolase [Ruminiclostridium papyrosolvens]EGD47591.1 beta-lactamase domain protein [Ruminiclostridium papyrosolvens DSM 2782]WES36464.1 MBL fold metallo-hydrolase [Ruminiclostridium papyrosolvens DSM 2782]
MKIHILTDNRTSKRGFLAEHGLSVYIEHKQTNILFDTGQSNVYCNNAVKMNIDLRETDFIVLSHGHYDHGAGLVYFPEIKKKINIYAHEDCFINRYAINQDGVSFREIGIPWNPDDREALKSNIVFTRETYQLAPDVYICGEIPRTHDFEEIPEGFFVGDADNKHQDMIKDEQMLVIRTKKGLCIFLGCSHPGIINCLTYVLKLFPGEKIDTVVGGMHLNSASQLKVEKTVQSLIDLNIRQIVPLHCTGIYAIAEMKRIMGRGCLPLCAGDTIEI